LESSGKEAASFEIFSQVTSMPLSIRRQLRDLIPKAMLRKVHALGSHILAGYVVQHREPVAGPLTIIGLLSSTAGLGVGARLCLSSLKSLGYKTTTLDLADRLTIHKNFNFEAGEPAKAGEGGLAIFHINPPELAVAINFAGKRLLKRKKIIGYWAWELARLPQSWHTGFRYVDEIWVPSHFVRDAVIPHALCPVRVVPHMVPKPICSNKQRIDFAIPKDAFVFLSMCDLRSSAARKNPLGAIRAFKQAFSRDDDAVLVLKISNPQVAPDVIDNLTQEIGHYRNIRLMCERLLHEDIGALIRASDAIVSLHRSEGFGLVLAEGMRLGKPVVATNWSGNVDFMSASNSILIDYRLIPVVDPQGIYQGQDFYWADPDIEHAAHWFRRLYEDSELRRNIGTKAEMESAGIFDDLERYRESAGL
jgi:glycosyltransferase involved in cell wall biosynthesis